MSALLGTVAALAYLWAFWGCYVLVMGLYRAHLDKRLGPVTWVLSAPFLALGWCMDVLANLLMASVVFLELPRELLVTQRLQRYMKHTDWRGKVAGWVCANLLDVFDPTGSHCD